MNDVFNLKNEKNFTLNFMPYKENFRVALAPQEMITIDTLTDEEYLYYKAISKDFSNPTDALFYANFLNGNDGVFTSSYGPTVDNADGTISIMPSPSNTGANTYFGSSDKNIPWKATGVTAKINININSASMSNNEYFNITTAINGDYDGNIAFLGERTIYFRKYSAGVKVGYEENGSSDGINQTATSNSSAVVIPDGNYTIAFYTHKKSTDNTIVMDITVINEEGSIIFSVKDGLLSTEIDIATEANIAGVRYLWFSSMNVKNGVKVNNISIN